jgi:hypothetical protein
VENNGWSGATTAEPLDFTTPDWFVGGAGQNWLGSKVSPAGDVNGDGYGDVVVGAPVYWNEEFAEGAIYVYLGSASGLSTTPQVIIESNITNIGFGTSVDTAGDVNGDGFDDIVWAPRSPTAAERRPRLPLPRLSGGRHGRGGMDVRERSGVRQPRLPRVRDRGRQRRRVRRRPRRGP